MLTVSWILFKKNFILSNILVILVTEAVLLVSVTAASPDKYVKLVRIFPSVTTLF